MVARSAAGTLVLEESPDNAERQALETKTGGTR